MGQVCSNVNRNLKWAFVEAGNLVVINQRRLTGTHAVRLYQRIKRAKNHQKIVVAVARHLAARETLISHGFVHRGNIRWTGSHRWPRELFSMSRFTSCFRLI